MIIELKKIVLLFLSFLFIFSGCVNTSKRETTKKELTISEVKSLIGQKDYSLVYLWTTWCGPCRKTISKTLPVIQKQLSDDTQMLVIAVSKDDEKVNQVINPTGLKAYRLSFEGPDFYFTHKIVLKSALEELFPKQKVWRNSVPVFFLVDKNMNVVIPKIPTDLHQALKLLNNSKAGSVEISRLVEN